MESKKQRNHEAAFAFILEDDLQDYRRLILQSGLTVTHFAAGMTITSSGTVSPCVYFLLDGIVKVSIININGYERILGYHKKNTIFAMDGLTGEQKVIVSTIALTPVTAVKLSADDLTDLFSQNPRFATDVIFFYRNVLKLMCYDAESQTSNSVRAKLANFMVLYMTSDDYAALGYLPFSQSELASAIGASRVQVARICADLSRHGIIHSEKKKVYINKPLEIRNMISFLGFE